MAGKELPVTVAIFILIYFLMALKMEYKLAILYLGLFLLFLFGILKFPKGFSYIDFRILGLFTGASMIAQSFLASKVPSLLAEIFVKRAKRMVFLILILAAFSGVLSAFLDNVSTVLILAPVALEVSKKLQVSPAPFILVMALTANLQGSATLIGDPPSMILAANTDMKFLDFFFMEGKPGIFFAVQIGFIFGLLTIYYRYFKRKEEVYIEKKDKVITYFPTIILISFIIALGLLPYLIKDGHYFKNASLTALFFGGIAFVFNLLHKELKTSHPLRNIDFETILFLAGIFILVGTLKEVGGVRSLTNFFSSFLRSNLLLVYISLILFAVFVSGFVDNIPFFLVLVEVLKVLAKNNNYPLHLLLFATLIGTTVGGNITPFGAQANIVGVGYLKKRGYVISFFDFVKIGLPFSLLGVLSSSIFLWLFWR